MTTNELCRRTRLTPRMIQWWCEKGVIRCGFPRGRREFDETQSLVAAMVAELRRKGVSHPRIRKLKLREPQGEYLVMNGAKAHLWCSEVELIPCVAECPGPCLVVSVEDLRRRLDDNNSPRFTRRKAN